MKLVTNVKAKYFASLNQFVKIREFTAVEMEQIFEGVEFTDRRSYIQFVINTCVVNYNDAILPAIRKLKMNLLSKLEKIEEDLYELCISVNPEMDIRQVTFAVAETPKNSLFLLEKRQREKRQKMDFSDLEDRLKSRVIGQEEAAEKVAQFVKRALVGLRNPEKPIGSLMFIGQTGVGKTEMAKALSAEIMDSESDLIRIDCSEYSQAHEYAKLLGAPPGYIGYDEGGMLSQRMGRRGMQVVLFDEIEKAHPRLHNLLLQILDEGMVHDSHGKRIAFNNAIIILTSNVGSAELERQNRPLGFVSEDTDTHQKNLRQVALRALERRFAPEFLNRLDEVVVFRELTRENLLKIIDILLKEVVSRLAGVGLSLEVTPEVKEFLVEKGYSPRYGARPLKRTVKQYVEVPLSEGILQGDFRSRGQLRAVLKKEEIVFEMLE